MRHKAKQNSYSSIPLLQDKDNHALCEGRYGKAICFYLKVLQSRPELSKSIAFNITLARKKYRLSREGIERPHVAVCGWKLANNSIARAYTLALLYEKFANVEIIGSICPGSCNEIWEQITNDHIKINTFIIEDESVFLEKAIYFVANNPFDIVHLSKPRASNIFLGILYKLIWDAKVLMDIDDEELLFVDAETPLILEEYIRQNHQLPIFKNIDGRDWTRLSVGLAKEFDGITVANSPLQEHYGGEIILHARDEKLFNPSKEFTRRNREKLGIPLDKKVVLFFGIPNKYKDLIEITKAISDLKSSDLFFVILGDCPDSAFKKRLFEEECCDFLFLKNKPSQEIQKIVSIADFCVLLQDETSLLTKFQIPALLSDVLGMGLVVLTNRVGSISSIIDAGVCIETDVSELSSKIKFFLDNPQYNLFQQQIARKYFSTQLCSAVVSSKLRHYVDDVLISAKATNLNLKKFVQHTSILPIWIKQLFVSPFSTNHDFRGRTNDNYPILNAVHLKHKDSLSIISKIKVDYAIPDIIVYTCNFGGYEPVREPLAMDSRVRYFLFTDDTSIHSTKWTVVLIKQELEDSRRSSRLAKILPHKYLPQHDISVYIDSSMQIIENDVVAMVNTCLESGEIALYRHYKRNCIYDEIDYVQSGSRMVSQARLIPMLEKYYREGYPKQNGLFENGFIFRKNTPSIQKLNELWWQEYSDGPERDQFSLAYCLWKLGISAIPITVGKQVRKNPFIKFYQHEYTKASPERDIQLYVFIAFAPKSYNMNLGRCYNEYVEMVPDDEAYVMFIDHDAVLLHPGWLDIAKGVIKKHRSETALFIAQTNRINNPYQRLNLLEHNHQLTDNIRFAQCVAEQYGTSTLECAKWPSSSGVILMIKKSSWRKHKFCDGFLKVDNNNHISYRSAGDKVYLMQGLYAYHFYRADHDISHAVRAKPAASCISEGVNSASHRIRNFVLVSQTVHEIDRYMRLLKLDQYAIILPNRAMFCSKDWYTQIERILENSHDIGVMVFNGNEKDIRAPLGSDVITHRNYAKGLENRYDLLENEKDLDTAGSSRAFMVSKKVWDEYMKTNSESDNFFLVDVFRVAFRLQYPCVSMNHVYVLDADVDHLPRVIKAHNHRRMRIGILTMGFWPAMAGMEMMVHNLATKLTEAGDLVVLFTPKPNNEFVEIAHTYLLIRVTDLQNMKKKFREFHASMPFDILYVQGAFEPTSVALELKRELGVPVVLRTHGEDIQQDSDIGYGYRMNPEKDAIIRQNICGVNHNIVIGPHILPEIKNITGRDDVTLIYNGVDVDHFKPNKTTHIHDVFKLQPSTKVLLMVGRNIKKKSLHLALDALAILRSRMPDVVLVHVGKSGNGENLRNYAERLGISDAFYEMGIVSYFDMPLIYNGADIFVFPSKIETFGNVTMEAMACGLPCVEFDYIVNRDKITDGQTGFVLPYGDVNAMSIALEKLLRDPLKLADFGIAARNRSVMFFSWWSVCGQYQKLFGEVIRHSQSNI